MNHSWDYGSVKRYDARRKTCRRCGLSASTFGEGAGRVWSFQWPDGSREGTGKTPPCPGKATGGTFQYREFLRLLMTEKDEAARAEQEAEQEAEQAAYTACGDEICARAVKPHKWAQIKAHEEGWFFTKNGEAWCPEHLPAWVGPWRARQRGSA